MSEVFGTRFDGRDVTNQEIIDAVLEAERKVMTAFNELWEKTGLRSTSAHIDHILSTADSDWLCHSVSLTVRDQEDQTLDIVTYINDV